MDIALSVTLGLLFLITAFAAVFLMFHLWGYPYDKVTRRSAAPPALMRLHRVLGWAYTGLYVVMMSEMVPRLWNYQVELPPRTVAHLTLGVGVGVILLVKLTILRFHRHLEEWMPVLGVLLLTFTILLCGLSIPFALREYALASSTVGGSVYSRENRERVARLLPRAGLPPEAPLAHLATVPALRRGRDVLVRKCVVCHDLKTILVRPRAPHEWVQTVERMSAKPSSAAPLSEGEEWAVSAYLIAITHDLHRSARERRDQERQHQRSAEAFADARAPADAADTALDPAAAKATFESLCAQCHGLADVDAAPPRSGAEVDALLQRMIDDNGMEAGESDLRMVRWYMVQTYAADERP